MRNLALIHAGSPLKKNADRAIELIEVESKVMDFKKKKKLLVINRTQFGYHVGPYYYCKYGRSEFDITYYGWDSGEPKFEVDGVKAKYVSKKGVFIVRYLRLLFSYIRECRKEYDAIFIVYFVGCSLLRILYPSKNIVLEIRTRSEGMYIKRKWNDFILRFESCFFKHISVISQLLAERLKLPKHKVHILPLGAEPIDVPPKKFDSLNLIYVGTFNWRRMEDTIKGFRKFYSEFGSNIEITYDIVGDGHNGQLEVLRKLVVELELDKVISLPGYIHQSQLKKYYERCNVGISYVPINDFYNCQPPTKTFEYALAGLPIIATATTENRLVITPQNGILIDDCPHGFYNGLKEVYSKRQDFCSERIKQGCKEYSWSWIVNHNLINYLKMIIKEAKA